jgi:hypothetical protein
MSEPEEGNWNDKEEMDLPFDPAVTRTLFRKWRAPRFGQSNPERMNNPVWEWLVRSRKTAYWLTQHFREPSALEVGPGWCFQRFGGTETILPDSRKVLIGGEHEDYYDPDFQIYNDVVVLHRGGGLDIFGYPPEVFPPTDFHSATSAAGRIFIIGGLGYPEPRKAAVTPVYCLDLQTFAISPFATSGPAPGGIHEHAAELEPDGKSITLRGGCVDTVRNINDWRLRLDTGLWEQLTKNVWQVWKVRRKDGELLHLWQIRSHLALQSMGQLHLLTEKMRKLEEQFDIPTLEEQIGGSIDAEAASQLFQPPVDCAMAPDTGLFNVHCLRISGVTVRYEESLQEIEVAFEGALPQKVINSVVQDLATKLTRLEGSLCAAKRT